MTSNVDSECRETVNTTLTTLQELALDLVTEDYASVAAIEEQVRLLMGNGVSGQQITGALEALRDLGLVQPFVRRESDGRFERYRRARLKAGTKLWWYATAAGRVGAAGR